MIARRVLLAALLAAAWWVPAPPAEAQMNPNVLRNQSRMVERAISRQSELIVRPRLVVAKGSTGPVSALALTPDEHFLLTAAGDNSVRVWDLTVGREVAALTGHAGPIRALAVDPQGKRAATVATDGTVRLWDLATLQPGAPLAAGGQGSAIAFIAEGRQLAVGGAGGSITLVDATSGATAGSLNAPGGTITALRPLAGGRQLLAATDGGVAVLDAATGATVHALNGLDGAATAIAIGRGEELAAAANRDGAVVVWNLSDGSQRLAFDAGSRPVHGLAVHERAGVVVTGSDDGAVIAWSLASGSKAHDLGQHDKAVSFAQIDGEGTLALTGSEDGTTQLWHLASGGRLVTLISTADGWAVVDAKGRFDGSQQAVDGIQWQSDQQNMDIAQFSERYYEPALLPRLLEGDALPQVGGIEEGIHLPPNVRFISPEEGRSGTRSVTVEVSAEGVGGGGVTDLRLFQNGKAIPAPSGEDRQDTTLTRRFQVELGPGQNVLSAVAVNQEQLESSPAAIVVETEGAAPRPKLHILTIGINKYKNAQLNLNYAVPDANALRDFFAQKGTGVFSGVDIQSLTDGQASREGILAALHRLRGLPPGDVAVVYMAGHGVSLEDEWYFIPWDVDRPDAIPTIGLSSVTLRQEVEQAGPSRLFLVIDACHSGTAVSPLKDYKGMKALRLLARSSGVHILAATDRNQFAVELEKLGHGIFTFSLLKALAGEADRVPQDGVVNVREAMGFVEAVVPQLSTRFADYAQYPTGHSRGTDFALSTGR